MSLLDYPFDAAQILQKRRALRKELLQNEPFLCKKIAIVSGSTVGDIRPVWELFLLHAGIKPTFFEGGYGLFYEDVVFDAGALARFAPDVLYIHTSNRNIRAWPAPAGAAEEAEAALQEEFGRFAAVWKAAEKLGCPVIQNNFEEPGFRHFGHLDAQDARGRVRFVRRLNELLAGAAAQNPLLHIHDLAWLAAMHGVDAWCDDAAWYAYKYALAPACIPHLGHSLTGLVKSLFGFTKKAVVCDLDNTLWGGVVGEAGAEGIELGSESPAGMAYADFQAYLRALAQRGILLAVASKNEESSAEAGLAREDSPLHRDDFLCFEANWNPKSQSVARIARQLNIGADSLVFVDDNPAEREEVRRVLPEVAAPPIGPPEDSVRLLDRAGFFEVSRLSADDAKRAEMYRQNAQRTRLQAAFADYGEYLKSLCMRAVIAPFAPGALERVTQLINKTNQFNLTTRRYTEPEVTACMRDAQVVTLSGHLVDKYGDNGITAVLIARQTGGALDIETFLMSCRVFKRGLEHAMFDALVAEAKRRDVGVITAAYLPTAKNLLCRDFYATIGFEPVEATAQKRTFRFAVPGVYQNQNTAIKVE